jgi:DNA-binding ferritin-like protein
MKLVLLDALLRLYEQNFRNLHWNAKGEDFNDSHKSITTEYYEMVSEDVDKIAEILAMLGTNPCNYPQALEIINADPGKFVIVDNNKLYTRAEIIEISGIMFKDICNILSVAIEELENPLDAGIRSELETLLYNYTLQYRYINKRRSM